METLRRRPFPTHSKEPLLAFLKINSLLTFLGLLTEQLNEQDIDFDEMKLRISFLDLQVFQGASALLQIPESSSWKHYSEEYPPRWTFVKVAPAAIFPKVDTPLGEM